MGIINEEIKYDGPGEAELIVVERTKGEYKQQWQIIGLEVDRFSHLTPRELRELGRWLVAQGRRIGREYKSNGAKK